MQRYRYRSLGLFPRILDGANATSKASIDFSKHCANCLQFFKDIISLEKNLRAYRSLSNLMRQFADPTGGKGNSMDSTVPVGGAEAQKT